MSTLTLEVGVGAHASLDDFRAALASLQNAAVSVGAHTTLVLPQDVDRAIPSLVDGLGTTEGSSVTSFGPSVHEATRGADAFHEMLRDALDTIHSLGSHQGELDGAESLIDLLAGLVADGHATADSINHQSSSLSAVLDGFASAVEHDHSEHLSGALTRAVHHVTEDLTQRLDHAIDDLLHDLTAHLVDFASEATHSGTELDHVWHSVIEVLANELRDELAHEIKDAVNRAIADGVEALATEFAEAMTEMTAGASITEAMMPVLPELVLAKKAAHFINGLLDLFDG